MPSLRRRRAFAIDVLVIDSEEEDMESTSVKFLIDSNQAISFRETFLLADKHTELDNASSCHPYCRLVKDQTQPVLGWNWN